MSYVDHISIDGVQYDIRDAEAVSFEQEQTLTDAQKEQARANIGAGSEADVVELKSAIAYDESVAFIPIYGKNLASGTEFESEKFVNWRTGETASNSSYDASGYVRVIKGQLYGFVGSSVHFAFYDSAKNYVGKVTASNTLSELDGYGYGSTASYSQQIIWFKSPITGFFRYTIPHGVSSGLRVIMAIHSSAEIINTTFPAYVDGVNVELSNNTDIRALSDRITETKSTIDSITEMVYSSNLLNFDDPDYIEGKYINTDGTLTTNSNYNTSGFIPVVAGQTYKYSYGTHIGAAQEMRFVCAFDADKNAVSASGSSSAVSSYTVPSGIAFVRFSAVATYMKEDTDHIMFTKSDVTTYSEYFTPYLQITEKATNDGVILDEINKASRNYETAYNTCFTAKYATLSANSRQLFLRRFDNKKNAVIEFIGYFSSFSSLRIGHGYNVAYGSYVLIDGTNISVYQGTPPSETKSEAHGLTFSDFIHVTITQNDKARATIRVMTASGDHTVTNVSWYGCNGNIFVESATEMTDCIINATFQDFNKRIFVFGDSYVSIYDAARWPYYIINNKQDNVMLAGYGGVNSATELTAFTNILANTNPQYVVWTLGQNDVDNGAVNASWLSCVNSVLATCAAKGIIPILATVPNCPNRDHTYKNAWVKASGYRYVDFAKAVGAENAGSTWYTGMLYSDNVHPSELGAKALYSRFLIDVPEVLNKLVT